MSPDPPRSVEIAIEDSGHGIEPDALERIFEPFYSSKERGQGTGLGLVVCRSIVLEHGGTIEVESEPGQGTRFRLCFPAAGDGPDAGRPPESIGSLGSDPTGARP